MSAPITLLLIAATCVVSLVAFRTPSLLMRLILWPPAIDRHRQYDRLVTYGFIHHCLQQPQTGWALVRIGGSAHWVTAEQFTRAHTALAALLPADAPLMLGLVYIEGVALMVLRRLLENVITFTEAETVIALAMQGIGVPAQRIPALQETARRFVSALSQH